MLKKISLTLTALGFCGFFACLFGNPINEITLEGGLMVTAFTGIFLYCIAKIWREGNGSKG